MSIDDARSRQQIKHRGIGKTSKRMNNIPSMTSVFQRIHPLMSEGREASLLIKERGHQEAIKMVAEVRDWNKGDQCLNDGVPYTQRLSILSEMSSGCSLIEERKQKRKKVLEQFIRGVKRQGKLTESMEARMRDDFNRQQEAEEQRLVEERKRQLERDEVLAWKLQKEEEMGLKQQKEQLVEEREIIKEFDKIQKQLAEDLRQQLDSKYNQEMEKLYGNEREQLNEGIRGIVEPTTRAWRKEGQEAPTPREPLICWRCNEMGHKKKDCVKLLFCINCG